MSWQVRLGNLDEEIEEFVKNNPDYPVSEPREFVKNAVWNEMKRYVIEKDKATKEDLEELLDKRMEEEFG